MPGSALRDLWKLSDRRHPNRPSGRFARACSSRPPVGGRAQIGHVAEFARVSPLQALRKVPELSTAAAQLVGGRAQIGHVADLPGSALRDLWKLSDRRHPKSAKWPICPGLLFEASGRRPSPNRPRGRFARVSSSSSPEGARAQLGRGPARRRPCPNRPRGRFARVCSSRSLEAERSASPKSAKWPICPGLLFEASGRRPSPNRPRGRFARVSSSSSPEGARAQLGRGPARRRPCPNRPRGRFARVCSSRSLEAERSASPKSAKWPICPGLLFEASGR